MSRCVVVLATFLAAAAGQAPETNAAPQPKAQRLVVLMVDGLGADLLLRELRQTDPETGRSPLPWIDYVFAANGTTFENFYTRGISLSAPSWQMLDTGRHLVLHGNVEFDRLTGRVYDYLNFVPFYLNYARMRQVDMPSVQVVDASGLPLLIDRFRFDQVRQSFQLFQRGIRWTTLRSTLKRRVSGTAILESLGGHGPSMTQLLAAQTEAELIDGIADPRYRYLDYFDGTFDHVAHQTNDPAALLSVLQSIDALAGRIWAAIQASSLARQTLFVLVSDHGMNSDPRVRSQTFPITDVFTSARGGGQHVITNRPQLSDYRLWGLDPLLTRTVTPSRESAYLEGEGERYPTVWLDVDGNERASVQLRSSALNEMHILLLQLAAPGLAPAKRRAAAHYFGRLLACHRAAWQQTSDSLKRELVALDRAIEARRLLVERLPKGLKGWSEEATELGTNKASLRIVVELASWEEERERYRAYLSHLDQLLAFRPDPVKPFTGKIRDLIPTVSLGEPNKLADLQHYVVGLSPEGLLLDTDGELDPQRSFRYVDYYALLTSERVRNNPQPGLDPQPVDFIATSLPASAVERALLERGITTAGSLQEAIWLYGDDDRQVLELVQTNGAFEQIRVLPVSRLTEHPNGELAWSNEPWQAGLPLRIYEDEALQAPAGKDREHWLAAWHDEREWSQAMHSCRYSNSVVGLTEQFYPVDQAVPDRPEIDPLLTALERRRRRLVLPDFQVFAKDHWNFNVRFPNPGGNHGSFLRISTHSVWMMAGAGIPHTTIRPPYDSLNFASTLLSAVGLTPPMPERVVALGTPPAWETTERAAPRR